TERSDFDIKSEKENRVISRWEKKVREAAKQSGQLFLTNIEKPVALKETIQSIHPADRIAVFHPTECTHSFKEWLGELKSGFKDNQKTKPSLHLFFGPEGGFSAAEIAFLRQSAKELKAPLDIVGLGDSILRLETAVYSVTGAIRLIFG
ncbi:MAG: RNA methyltransferase, partial [Sinomicrobium sp.]|nr:RNA methyltransferase [Sinomicrobium sp.]